MQILTQTQIRQKIDRLAYQILEHNYGEKELILAGINFNGMSFAGLLKSALQKISKVPIRLTQIRMNPAKPLGDEISLGISADEAKGRVIIVVDDVANTGRTIFYAMKPILESMPRKVEIAVLVDRKHKSFPIAVDYVGLSLATTIQENIDVRLGDKEEWSVHLN